MRRSTLLAVLFIRALPLTACLLILLPPLALAHAAAGANVDKSDHSYRVFEATGTNDPCNVAEDTNRVVLHKQTAERLVWHFANSCKFKVKLQVDPPPTHVECTGDFPIGRPFFLENLESKVIVCKASSTGRQKPGVRMCTIPAGADDCGLPAGPRPGAHELEIEVP